MLVKSAVLLFCCALINAKSLVPRDPRLEGRGEIEDAKLSDILKGFLRNVKIHDVDRLGGDDKLGVNLQVEQEEDDDDDDAKEEEKNLFGADEEEKQAPENPKAAADQEDDEDDEDEGNDDEERVENENNENKKDQNKSNDEEEEEEEEEEEDADDEKTQEQEESESGESSEEERNELTPEDTPKLETHAFKLSDALVGSEMKSPETFKLSKQSLNLPSPAAVKTPTADDELADKVANFFALESLLKGFLPSEDSSPKEPVSKPETDEESLIKEIDEMEKTNKVAEEKIVTSNQAPGSTFDFDLDDTKQLGALISQAVPKNFDMIQAQFQGAKDFWKKTTFDDLQAKLQQGVQDFWQKTNFNDLLSKFQQGAKSLLQENTKEDTKESLHKDSKVGFGGFFNNKNNKLMFSNATTYVNKAVQRAQAKLDENGRIIYANNPPLTINVIPGTPITFKLKYVEGAHTLDTYGQSKAIHYGKVYAFTQYKFTELRYYYDVIISPYNLYNIRKSIAVILNDAPVKMNVAVDNDNKMNIMALEFVNPEIEVDSGSNRFVQYSLNYLINRYPVIKQKLVEIASRDSKLLLSDYLKDAQ